MASTEEAGFVRVDGVRLAWTRTGRPSRDAPSLLLAHGLTDSAECWDPVASVLALSYDVVRYDARGHGASDRASDYSVDRNTADLVGLARALRLDRPVLVGHSMGSNHAVLAAAQLEVRALILEDPGAWPEVPEDGTKDIAASRRRVAEVAALPEDARRAHGRALHPTWADRDLEAWVRAQSQVDLEVVSWFNSWPTTNRWRDHVAALHSPGLLLIGDETAVTPNVAAQAQRLWPQLQTVQIEGAGHNVRRDQFMPYWEAVSTFLRHILR